MIKVLFVLFIFLTSCSFKSIIIPNLAFIIADRIDSSLHLYNEQEYQVRRDIEKLLTEEKDRIEAIQKYFNKIDIKNIDAKKGYSFFSKNYYELALKVNRILARQFSTLDNNQIAKFKESILEENEEIIERTKERGSKDYYKRYIYFFGELTKGQKSLIDKNLDNFKKLANKRMVRRKATQKNLLISLSLNNNQEKEKLIIALFNENADISTLTPERIKSINQFKDFVQSLTSKQETHFKKKLVFFNEWVNEYLKNY